MIQTARSTPRSRVLAAAAEIFARSGFEGARVDEIATLAGVNKAMVYYHVGDKSHIYETIVADRAAILLAAIRGEVDREQTPQGKLRAAIGALAHATTSNAHFAPIMLREIASGGAGLPANVLRKASAVFQQFRIILEEGSRTGAFRVVDPVTTHMMIAGVVMLLSAGTPLRLRLRSLDGGSRNAAPERGSEELAQGVFELVMNGLRVSGEGESCGEASAEAVPSWSEK